MAHKKGVGSTDNGRDSNPKYLGVKIYGGTKVRAGNIIVRQRGTKFHAGTGTYLGKDFTLHAKVDGVVKFRKERKGRTFVYVTPNGELTTQSGASKPSNQKTKSAPTAGGGILGAVATAAGAVTGAVEAVAEKVAEVITPNDEPTSLEAAAAAAAGADAVTLPSGKKIKQDDLKVVEGIGPKIEELLHNGGIKTWNDLATADLDKVQQILNDAGSRYRIHNPKTWAQQAQLCVDGNWAELEDLQDRLQGGKEVA